MPRKRFDRQCPDCHGMGGSVDIICDGQGPFETCGWCQGEGRITKKRLYFECLGYISGYKRSMRSAKQKNQRP